MSRLFYIDDQTDFLPVLLSKLSSYPAELELIKYVGADDPVSNFIKVIRKEHVIEKDCFLLDINMPAPPTLKRKKVWPESIGEDYNQFCGIALAKWLEQECGVKIQQITFITHWQSYKEDHIEAIEELGLDLPDENYITKNDLGALSKWLKKQNME
ncbi:MAG: hypothetical protein GY862_38915 [Gammaproteobacteria bacterium]|nr:hypothetical protein [Gammaproteobacteria bacterium]